MKLNKNLFISVLLVLMVFCIIGAVSADDSLDNNLTAENSIDDAVSVDMGDSIQDSLKSTDDNLLSDGETIIYVDSSYDGNELGTEDNPYKKISTAVSNINGGEIIFIKNGLYSEDPIKDIDKQVTFQGESQDGVIIQFGTTGFFSSTKSGYGSFIFKDLTFKDSTATGANMAINIGGNGDVNITDCTFDNVAGRYGAVRIFTSGTVLIDNCKFLNTKSSTGSYASAIDFGGSSDTTYTLRNTIIDNSTISSISTATYIFGVIYAEKSAGTVILDNVIITNCNVTASGLISAKGNIEIRNSKFANNYVYRDNPTAGLFFVSGAKNFTLETTILANNSQPNYIFSANSGNANYIVNYNNIQNNTFNLNATNPDYGNYNLDYNYWGSNDEPSDVTVNNWAIDDNGVFKLNDGSELAKEIPRIGEAPVGDENSTWVSLNGDDNNVGSADSPVATIAKAVELAKTRNGEIFIEEGTYMENGIDLGNTTISITGIGNVVIDGNGSSNSIFMLHGGAATLTNIRFTNNKARYGGAIMVNSGTGTSRNVAEIDLTIDNCTFDNIGNSRGGSLYVWYTTGNLLVKDSKFINSTVSGWGGAICVGYSALSDGLNMEISGSTFEDCSGNNGGAAYLQANTLTITDSIFNHNTASYDSGAMQIYNSTATIDNCIITNNQGGSQGVAIKETMPSKATPRVLTITNSIIENNSGVSSTLPAIYVDMTTLDVSYTSLVNDLSVETRTATGYDAIYGQGIATLNNNWWGTNDPSTKVTGTNITMDNWVIMNVEANVSEALIGDSVKLTVDFNHVNTTAGDIEELTGGVIPKTHKVQFASESGTFVPASLSIKEPAVKTSTYTVGDINDVVTVSSEEAIVELTFIPESAPYYGIIYVSKDGDDNNNGSEEAPVATIAKAIELASVVGGSGQIVVNEGTYNGTDYLVTKDLTISGAGNVIFDAEGKGRFFYLPSTYSIDQFELNNLTLTNSSANPDATSGYYGTIIYNYAASNVVLNNVRIVDNDGDIATLISTNGNNLVINNSIISDNVADKLIAFSGKYDSSAKYFTIVNTTFENNVAPDYRIIEAGTSSGTLTLNLTDSHFINNTGKLGIVQGNEKTTVNVVGTEFINNTNTLSSGGAIEGATLNIENSSFIDNKAARDAGAILVNKNGGGAVITRSTFINNTAGEKGSAIYNKGKTTINYSLLLSNSDGYIIYHDGDDNILDANYNWWGTNDNPSTLIGLGTYEDDLGDDVPCEYDASNWVVMNVNNNLTSQTLDIDDQIEFTVDFNHYTDATGVIQELDDSIPEVEVSASAINGDLDKQTATTENGVANFVYTATTAGEDTITIASTNAVNVTEITVNGPVVDVIYVAVDGDDSNNGSQEAPVATIAKAIEMAENGKIVILEGTYTIGATLVTDKDMDIRGEGAVIIDGNMTRILENTANLNLTNIQFTNAKYGFGSAILDDGNVTIDGCTFYSNKATASTSGNIINNRKGTMTINDSIFYGNAASRGAVASQAGTKLIVNNSQFYDNDMSLSGSSSYYGIIYSTSADTIVENTVFRNNKAKQGGAIWATRSTSATTGSLEVNNCTFENNIAEIGTGGAIFTSGKVTAVITDSTFINNSATKSDSGVGGNGGAIYTTGTSEVSVADSVFIDNSGDADAGIYASGNSFAISNSVILAKEGDTNFALNTNGATVTAENNFWGDNTKANTNANVNKWVIMNATYDEATGALDITFDKTNSTGGAIADYEDVLPDGFNVSVSSSTGALDETLPVIDGHASTTYTTRVSDNITVKSGNAEVVIEIVIEPQVIYVARDGDDANDGSRDSPVATIAKAIELADEGRIVILSGTYATGDLGIISNDLNITGEGTVVIDAQNANRILYVGEDANVVLENLILINGAHPDESGALLGNSHFLTLINCTLANSSAGEHNGGAIYNVGKLTIINSTIANNTAKEGGAIFTNDALAVGPEITIINSTFENNIANGNSNLGGGAIFAQQLAGLTITNTTFIGNEALTTSSGGAIFISHSTADLTIDDSRFIQNHANGQDGTGGGAIYMTGTSNYERKGKLTITNTLFEENTADENGAAIYARATTVTVSNSVIFANKDPNGFAVYGYKTEQVAPAITLNDNWWGSNDNPIDLVGGNNNYKPTVSRWVILTANNDTPIVEGNSVKITVSLDTYTDGETNGTLATPITIPRDVTIVTTFEPIDGVLENGVFTTNYVVPEDLDYLSALVDVEEIVLFKELTETELIVEDITAEVGSTATIIVTVNAADDSAVTVGEVEVYFGDELVATIPVDEDGTAIQEVNITKEAGVYEILAKYSDPTGEYKASESNATLNITKKNANLNITDINVDEFNNVVITIEIDEGVEGNVTFTVSGDGGNYTGVESIVNGSASYAVPDALGAGDYDVSVVFDGNTEYNEANASDIVTLSKINTILSVPKLALYNSTNFVVATLTDEYGNIISGHRVKIVVGNMTKIVVTDENGQASMDVSSLEPGKYKVAARSGITSVYNEDKAFGSGYVCEGKVNTTLTISDMIVVGNSTDAVVVATLKDVYGNIITGVKVKIVVGNLTKLAKTDDNGQVSLDISSLEPGQYKVAARSGITDIFNESRTNAKAIISEEKLSPIFDMPDVVVVGDTTGTVVVATLKDQYGNIISGLKVKLVVGNMTKIAKTDENGQISMDISDLEPGVYKVAARSATTDIYQEVKAYAKAIISEEKINITIKLPNVEIQQGAEGAVAVATLKDSYGYRVSGVKVKLVVGDLTKIAKTDVNGQISLDISSLEPGEYKMAARSASTEIYNESIVYAKAIIN